MVVDTGSPLFGLFVSPAALDRFNGAESGGTSVFSGVAHVRPDVMHVGGSRGRAHEGRAGAAGAGVVSASVASTRASAKKAMGSVIRILPVVGVVVLVLLLLFLKVVSCTLRRLLWHPFFFLCAQAWGISPSLPLSLPPSLPPFVRRSLLARTNTHQRTPLTPETCVYISSTGGALLLLTCSMRQHTSLTAGYCRCRLHITAAYCI